MGLFDSVYVPCPQCGKEHEFQSKALNPHLHEYTLETAPDVVLADIGGRQKTCDCGATFSIVIDVCAQVQVLAVGNEGAP